MSVNFFNNFSKYKRKRNANNQYDVTSADHDDGVIADNTNPHKAMAAPTNAQHKHAVKEASPSLPPPVYLEISELETTKCNSEAASPPAYIELSELEITKGDLAVDTLTNPNYDAISIKNAGTVETDDESTIKEWVTFDGHDDEEHIYDNEHIYEKMSYS